MNKEKVQKELLTLKKKTEIKSLTIYNDDINTFDHVINSLIKICKHDSIQAEQCTWIIHLKGKCSVKHGSFLKLKPLCQAFIDLDINASIE